MIRYGGEKIAGQYTLSCKAPVLELDYDTIETYPNDDTLPGIWYTEPVEDYEGNYLGRTYKMVYPFGCLDAKEALDYGSRYYIEGMGYTNPADHEKRLDCFRAAEIFYRHAAGLGNVTANLDLGYVYSYDRCEGQYWRDCSSFETAEDYAKPYPREERAFECFSLAAEAGIAEACYKLGDLYKDGIGCGPNASEAFRWYMQAFELAAHETPVIMGSIAFRLAGCFENGFGCTQNFGQAFTWYQKAVEALEIAVDHGDIWYEKDLADARAGLKRCKQEVVLSGATARIAHEGIY